MVKLQKQLVFKITRICICGLYPYIQTKYVFINRIIRYLQIEPSKKGTHNNNIISLKFFTYVGLSDEQSVFDGLEKIIISSYISLLSLQMKEFLQ